jgi:hypothetical protein
MARYFSVTSLLFSALLMMGCHSGTSFSGDSTIYHYQNKQIGYSLDVPKSALKSWKGSTPSDGADTGFATFPVLTDPKANDYSIIIRTPTSKCSPTITGASEATPLPEDNSQTIWGKVDMFDHLNFESGDGAYGPLRDVVCRKMPESGLAAVYALCSEKDGKTVVICISQMTDNREQAKEIFETFRWTQ